MSRSNVAILQDALTAFGRGDFPAVLAACHENIACHIPGANLVSGDYTGHQEFLGFFKKLSEHSAGTIKVVPREFFDNGCATVVVLVTISAARGGREISFDAVQVWRFEDGKATSLRYFYANQAELDAFWV
jgi:ketosteroid isomerase-like protein